MALVSVSDFEKRAGEILPQSPWNYYQSGAEKQLTLALNQLAFDSYRICPRVLVDVSKRSQSTSVLGLDLNFPIAIAPTAMQGMANPEGETATVRAAEKLKTIYTMSTLSTTSIEDIGAAGPNAFKWFQLYIYKNREISKRLIRRAEKAGFKALVLTVDSSIFGVRRSDTKNKFKLPKYLDYAVLKDDTDVAKPKDRSAFHKYVLEQFDSTVTWKDVEWLVNFTHLPVVLKGILTKRDAVLATKSGCKGIIVSNHGARQLDSVPATIEALPEIVEAVGDKVVVMFDGGIRTGTDVFKAIALGAQLVFIGRPILYGLAVDGQNGIEQIFEILVKEFDAAMALAGVNKVNEISSDFVVHASHYAQCKCKL